MSIIVKNESGLLFQLNQDNLTAQIIKSDVKGHLFIPRSINYQSKDYIITKINESAFRQNQSLESVQFPDNSEMRSIGEFSFSFSSIQSISIPPSIKKLKYGWCSHTWGLFNVSLSPGNENFAYLDSERKIIVGKSHDGVENFNVIVFGCRDIQKLIVPPTIQIIGPFAFSACENLTEVTFSEDSDLQTIGDFAFSFTRIKRISIPFCVKQIGNSAFSECHYIESFEFPENSELQIIGKDAFSLSSINFISLPATVSQIGERAFADCSKLQSVEFPEKSKLKYISKNIFSHSTIEKFTVPRKVTQICEGAFSECYLLNSIEFEKKSKLRKIEKSAFADSSLQSLFIPPDVEEICDGWCSNTQRLSKLTISPKNSQFTYLKDQLLIGKSKSYRYELLLFANRDIKNAIIPSFVKNICSYSFAHCRKLETITFPENSELASIGSNAFFESTLKKLTIPSKTMSIGDFAFADCICLESVNFEKGSKLTTIGKYAFSNSLIKRMSFPENLEELKNGWCCYTRNLNHITISPLNKNFAFIDEDQKIIVGKSNKKVDCLDEIVFACRDIKSIFIPSYIKCISPFAFYGCYDLKTVEYSEDSNLHSINKYAFSDSSIKRITIPVRVEKIGTGAFTKCDRLKSVKFSNEMKKIFIMKNAFAQSSLKNVVVTSKLCHVGQSAFSYCANLSSAEFLGNEIVIEIFCFCHSEHLLLVSFPNARKATVDYSSFEQVSDDLSLFCLQNAVTVVKYDFFDMEN